MSEILSERIPLELEGTPVSSIMIEEPFTCTQDCTISDVVRMLAENEVSSMPVIDERNQVVGFISDGDVMGAIAQHRAHTIFTGGDASMLYFDDQSLEQRIEDLKDRCVMDFATRQVVCARPEQSIARVAALLAKKKFKKLPPSPNTSSASFSNRGRSHLRRTSRGIEPATGPDNLDTHALSLDASVRGAAKIAARVIGAAPPKAKANTGAIRWEKSWTKIWFMRFSPSWQRFRRDASPRTVR